MKIGMIAVTGLLLVTTLGTSCTSGRDFNARLNAVVRPYVFSVVGWEFNTLFDSARQLFGRDKTDDNEADEVNRVAEYFSAVDKIKKLESEIEAVNAGNKQGDINSLETEINELQQQKKALEKVVQSTIKRQIREALVQQGIFHPADKYIRLKVSFPPLNFKLGKPPHLLVISPRDRIESMREITLQQGVNLEQTESIEASVDELGVSSLVVKLGGFGGTYPSFVTDEASLRFILNTATEEWVHQYLAFKPLGFRYTLDLIGIARNYEIATMNETVASMVSKEIGAMVYEKYYSQLGDEDTQKENSDFDREMREIRKTVDRYLAEGEIEQAEQFMEQKRQSLAGKGYHIRKLNQAYFAFYGAYADRPDSISPIGTELKQLREQSASLKDFLETAAAMTSRQDLALSVKAAQE